jgi:hypothetical protein
MDHTNQTPASQKALPSVLRYGHLVPEASARARDAPDDAFSSALVHRAILIPVAPLVSGVGGGRVCL